MSFLTLNLVMRTASPLWIATPKVVSRVEYSFQSIGVGLLNERSMPFSVPGMSIFATTCLPTK